MAVAPASASALATWAIPPLGLLVWAAFGHAGGALATGLLCVFLIAGVIVAVQHAEVVAHRLGEPYGTLVLTLSVTIIEVSMIVSMMLNGSPNPELVRDTVHAAVILVLHGVAGLCIVAGTLRHREQEFSTAGASAFLSVLIPMIVLVLVLPNYTTSVPGPYYSKSQLLFVAGVCLTLYAAFLFVQTVRHKDYFLVREPIAHAARDPIPPTPMVLLSAFLLVLSLSAVVLMAEALAPFIESSLAARKAPDRIAGIIVAAIVLLPETMAALKAARRNRLQTSINLALGSALSSIGLTIPTVVVIAVWIGHPLALGTDAGSTVLLALTFVMAILTYGQGRTNLLSGFVHLVLLVCYVFLIFDP